MTKASTVGSKRLANLLCTRRHNWPALRRVFLEYESGADPEEINELDRSVWQEVRSKGVGLYM
jgi:hypothetical protein